MYFDTHAHYDDEQFDSDRDDLLHNLHKNGIELILNPGCDEISCRKALSYAEKYPFVYAAVGFHPENLENYGEGSIDLLRSFAQMPKVKAIGEIGLDYYWPENPPREFQQKAFREQLLLARELSLPVIVHDREAHGDCMEIIREFPDIGGVFHCYSGSAEMAEELVKRGWYISFTGAITFKNARRALETIRICPIERIMLETDSPYLSPVPFRGKRNDSGRLPYIAEVISEIKGISLEETARICLENGKKLFRI